MNWINLILGAFSLVRELVKLSNSSKEKRKHSVEQLRQLRAAMKKAREDGKIDELEKLITQLSIDVGDI